MGVCLRGGRDVNERDQATRATVAPRQRDATLRAAFLRIGASLDLDSVLREVVDGARAMTGARYGVITTVDGAGSPTIILAGALPHRTCYRATIVASQFLLPKEATMSTISAGTRQELVAAVADRYQQSTAARRG